MQSSAVVVSAIFVLKVASCRGLKIISGSGRFGSLALMFSNAALVASAISGCFRASLDAPMASRADTTKTMELMVSLLSHFMPVLLDLLVVE